MAQPQSGAGVWMFDYRNPSGSVVYWLDLNGNVGLTGIYFADGTIQTTAGGGGGRNTVQTFTSNTALTIAASTNYFIQATGGGGGITLTLPTAAGIAGQNVCIKKIDSAAGAVTVGTTSAQTIDSTLFGTSYILSNYMQFVTLESDGSNWFVVANN